MKKIISIITIFSCIVLSIQADNLLDLREVLDSQKGQSFINIPKGTYQLDLMDDKNAYQFFALKNTVIDGNGSTIVCNRQEQAFSFQKCEDVTFRNLSIEYDPPCATQGTITAVSTDKLTWTVTIHEGYPTAGLTESQRILVYDKETRELKENFTTVVTSNYILTYSGGKTNVQFTVRGWDNMGTIPVELGDYVALPISAEGHVPVHALTVSSCKRMVFERVTIYDSNSFSFFEYDCEANRYTRCVVTRKINDPKYKEDRLRAGMADAFHSKHAKVGPLVEDCRFEYSGDDCIAINGAAYPVYAVDKAKKTISFLTKSYYISEVYVRKNDRMVCVNNNGSIRGKAVVETAKQTFPSEAQCQGAFSKLSTIRDSEMFQHGMTVELDKWIEGVSVGDVIYSDDRIGRGFRLVRDTIGGNRSRGILLKSSEGIVEDCYVRNCAMSGIAIAPEFYWMEAGCPSNMIIRNNTIENCMYDANKDGTSQFASLVVTSMPPNGGSFAPAGSLNKISIYDNTITDCPYPAVGLTSIDGVYFANNTIAAPKGVRTHGISLGVPNNRALFKINTINFSTTEDVNDTSVEEVYYEDVCATTIVNGVLQIRVKGNVHVGDFTLYDLFGCIVVRTCGSEINISTLPKGVYIVKTEVNNKVYTKKMLL